MNGNVWEITVFSAYLLFMLGIGVYFFIKQKNGSSDKTYFLGDRKMGPWVSALSAGASDMSAWVLMGLPTSIFALGIGEVWIAVGLILGYSLSWILEACRLRKFSILADDSITVPQYLTNRFLSKSPVLQILCAVVFLIAYTIYTASSIKACGTLFATVLGINGTILGMNGQTFTMILAAFILISYTFLGGFNAVCWTDFFQGLLILGAMFIAPIFAVSTLEAGAASSISADFWNIGSWQKIASGLAWGLGYFGMPHIIIRFMSLKSQKDVKKSAKIGIAWTLFVLLFAVVIAIIARMFITESAGYSLADIETISKDNTVFIVIVRKIFAAVPIISGVLLAAILAASMSTADSQLLAASSAFSSDVYKPVIRKEKATDKEMSWIGRVVVLIVAFIALLIALLDEDGTIMSLVSNAWGVFGAAFGPVILLSLFWKRFNFAGAVAGIVAGAAADLLWLRFLSDSTEIYELLPAFVIGGLVAILVSLITKKPSAEVEELFDKAVAGLGED